MAGPVDKIYVEIAAPIQRLDRDMTANERRVDQGANRMAASVRKAERNISSPPGGLAARVAGTPQRLLGGVIGLSTLNAVGHGYADALKQADASWENIAYNSAKHLPLLSGIVDAADQYYAKLYDISTLESQMGAMDRRRESIQDFNKFIDLALPQSRVDAATDPEEKKRLEREKTLDQLDAEYQRRLDQANALWGLRSNNRNPAKLMEQVGKLNQWLTNEVTAANNKASGTAKARFDAIGTVFGGMRIATRDKAKPPANEETQKKQVDEQKKTNGLLTKIERAIGRNGVWA